MYGILLMIHSLFRWLVLLVLLIRVGRGVQGLATKVTWDKVDRVLGIATVACLDLQLVMGLGMYGLSPKVAAGLADMGAAMGETMLRFWVVEHPTTMVLALVAAHVGHALSKRSNPSPRRHQIATVGFGLALLFVLLGIPWAFRGPL